MSAERGIRSALAATGLALGLTGARASAQDPVVVAPAGPVRTIADGVRRASPGATVVVRAGTYREPTIVVDRPLHLVGEPGAVIDGEGKRQLLVITADDVTVRGLTLRHVGTSYVEDRAAIRAQAVRDCAIEHNRIEDGFFGIYLAEVARCRVVGNELRATLRDEAGAGNGIHLWSSRDVSIAGNRVQGHRDGIYFEFVRAADVRDNVSEGNLRYGLHFMYSDSCRYRDNVFRRNGSGVAVMYTKNVHMTGNRFEDNRGGAAYGLLLKEIYDSRLERNRFARNSTGLMADGANRLTATGNAFVDNGWAVRLLSSTQDASFSANDFVGNTFDVATNSKQNGSTFAGNYWSDYRGYDLDRDGSGDVPHHPVRLFSLVVEQNPPALILLHGIFVGLLDAAERLLPSLTPETLVDERPAMHPNGQAVRP